MQLSEMARSGRIRTADEQLARIILTQAEVAPLAAFLNSLNDDLTKLKKK
jgi:hypothetical protein